MTFDEALDIVEQKILNMSEEELLAEFDKAEKSDLYKILIESGWNPLARNDNSNSRS